ncbi:hypothetical protein F1188_03825 [Roseospira marina]|uniref:Uncharacterized protein n=1 Tax=Roseospira marina TaxID=140057 RepID=A0A5M6IFM3_9PROT|nr:hypothetical protein [Roseospira marina]KAA5607044.1 hypothetical protein F1188_03825 [Roseospira marina]MBB4312768.1 hypothetical protein [Roseospira marina]MBB5086459.1 hypothetical protein [Roseospira marina]
MSRSESLRNLGRAIATHPVPAEAVFVGFDLYLQVFASGKVRMIGFTAGGQRVAPEDARPDGAVPFPAIGRGVVVCFDPTLEPEAFRVAP